jgi:hypothetical protein
MDKNAATKTSSWKVRWLIILEGNFEYDWMELKPISPSTSMEEELIGKGNEKRAQQWLILNMNSYFL